MIGLLQSCNSGPTGPWQENCRTVQNNPDEFTVLKRGNGSNLFTDLTLSSGTGHIHDLTDVDGPYDASNGGGVAIADFNLDGRLDIIVTGGREENGYYVNQGQGTFLNCGSSAGLNPGDDWTNGVSIADIDNDGDLDVLLLNYGPNRLLRNIGDGSFEDITEDSQLSGDYRSAGASWADLDGDGLLDLLISNLADEFLDTSLKGAPSELYRNLGNGRFEDVSEQVGNSGMREGASYLAPLIDFDNDGLIDILITQEFGYLLERNQLYRNLGPGTGGNWLDWENRTPESNIKYPFAVMGAAIMDLNQDQLPDLFMTNLLTDEPFREVLLMNDNNFVFNDITDEYNANGLEIDADEGLYRTASWGSIQFDYDNDGDEDLYTVYGIITPVELPGTTCQNLNSVCPHQPNLLLENDNNAGFQRVAGSNLEDNGIGRGVAAADINDDGCLDLYLVNQNTPSRLLINECLHENYSFFIHLEGTVSNRNAVGARAVIKIGENIQTKYVTAGSTSVHSSQPFRIHVGTGNSLVIDELEIYWPSGLKESFEQLTIDSVLPSHFYIREGDGTIRTSNETQSSTISTRTE